MLVNENFQNYIIAAFSRHPFVQTVHWKKLQMAQTLLYLAPKTTLTGVIWMYNNYYKHTYDL
jgi:hypothetical protein